MSSVVVLLDEDEEVSVALVRSRVGLGLADPGALPDGSGLWF